MQPKRGLLATPRSGPPANFIWGVMRSTYGQGEETWGTDEQILQSQEQLIKEYDDEASSPMSIPSVRGNEDYTIKSEINEEGCV
jgi:hypothetical protein